MSKERRQAISGLSRRDLIHNALVLAAARLTAPFAGSVAAARLAQSPFRLGVASGSGNERAIVDLDCRHHGYVVCDVTKDDFQVAAMRVTPNAFVGNIAESKAEVGMRYRVNAGDLEPRKV